MATSWGRLESSPSRVISPSESAVDVERKVELFFAHGGRGCLGDLPQDQNCSSTPSPGDCSSLHGLTDSLTLPGILPGWTLPVAKLFENE